MRWLIVVAIACAGCGPDVGADGGVCTSGGTCDSGLVCTNGTCAPVDANVKACCECMTGETNLAGEKCFPISVDTCEQRSAEGINAECFCWKQCANFCAVPAGC